MSIFTKTQGTKPQYSTFDLSHQMKLTAKMGQLIPILCEETLPGDMHKINTSLLIRYAPLIAPLMHQVTAYVHYWHVPNRLVWENFENFITGGEDGTESPLHPVIKINGSTWSEESLQDYMGFPRTAAGQNVEGNAMAFAAYFKIYNEYYRDQNLVPELQDTCNDGESQTATFKTQCQGDPLYRSYQHDYFTSCLPFTQKGPQATIPIGGSAPVEYDLEKAKGSLQIVRNYLDSSIAPNEQLFSDEGGFLADAQPTGNFLHLDLSGTHVADLSQATSASINDLRSAFALQLWLERNARAGSRYVESILAHFGVVSPDARLQRPEYLGGGSVPIQVSEVLQHSPSEGTETEASPQGNMAGHGIGAGQTGQAAYRSTEHGFIIGILSVLPKTAYHEGIDKMHLRRDRFDYAFPEFAQLGEQAVYKKEVYYQHIKPDDPFGYLPRYAEYKYRNDKVAGRFKTNLDFWHLSRKLSNTVALNRDFIECRPEDVERIFAVWTDADGNDRTEQMYITAYHNMTAKRPLPYFGTPKLIG